MTLRQYMIDAFTDEVFHGNQAAVCATDEPLSEALMQAIACENNFSEMAFLVPLDCQGAEDVRLGLRWFTPGGEIDLCGHATLASAFAVNRFLSPGAARVVFETRSGEILVSVDEDWLTMDMPAFHLCPVTVIDAMEQALGVRPVEAWIDRDLVCLLSSERAVRECVPDMGTLERLDGLGCCITAAADDAGTDFVSRFFAPKLGGGRRPGLRFGSLRPGPAVGGPARQGRASGRAGVAPWRLPALRGARGSRGRGGQGSPLRHGRSACLRPLCAPKWQDGTGNYGCRCGYAHALQGQFQ